MNNRIAGLRAGSRMYLREIRDYRGRASGRLLAGFGNPSEASGVHRSAWINKAWAQWAIGIGIMLILVFGGTSPNGW